MARVGQGAMDGARIELNDGRGVFCLRRLTVCARLRNRGRSGKLHERVEPEVKQAPCCPALPQVATVIYGLLTMGAVV